MLSQTHFETTGLRQIQGETLQVIHLHPVMTYLEHEL